MKIVLVFFFLEEKCSKKLVMFWDVLAYTDFLNINILQLTLLFLKYLSCSCEGEAHLLLWKFPFQTIEVAPKCCFSVSQLAFHFCSCLECKFGCETSTVRGKKKKVLFQYSFKLNKFKPSIFMYLLLIKGYWLNNWGGGVSGSNNAEYL